MTVLPDYLFFFFFNTCVLCAGDLLQVIATIFLAVLYCISPRPIVALDRVDRALSSDRRTRSLLRGTISIVHAIIEEQMNSVGKI
jgi:hypothetical protein